jgi:hypothetical protein
MPAVVLDHEEPDEQASTRQQHEDVKPNVTMLHRQQQQDPTCDKAE